MGFPDLTLRFCRCSNEKGDYTREKLSQCIEYAICVLVNLSVNRSKQVQDQVGCVASSIATRSLH